MPMSEGAQRRSAGGDDFDDIIVAWLAAAHLPGVDWKQPAVLANLKALAEAAKVTFWAPCTNRSLFSSCHVVQICRCWRAGRRRQTGQHRSPAACATSIGMGLKP